MKKILVIDNYDSFVFNLVHYLHGLGNFDIVVKKNDKITLDEVNNFDKILLSPGPGVPKDAGLMPQVLQQFSATKSILGVCLGHQAIGEAFGCSLTNLPEPLHGIASQISVVENDYLFEGLPTQYKIGHYHSWVINPASITSHIQIIATDERQNIMAVRHKLYDVRGVQFHPESVLTEHGMQLLGNWVNN